MLGGRPRVVHAQQDVAARAIPDTIVVEDPGMPGEDIRLTIDAGLQLAIESEVLAAWAADKAKSVSAVVMDPYTGEILAEATYPSYDGNDYQIDRRDGARSRSSTRSSAPSTSPVRSSRC